MKVYREQLWRTGIIGVMLAALLAAVIALYASGEGEDFRARMEGALMLLVPAFLDSLRVQKRQTRRKRAKQKSEREQIEEALARAEEDTAPC